jgi:Arc/MetJ-type ribon-helix-helix transcriptional regulator
MRPKIPDSDKRKDKLIIRVSMEEKLRIRTLTKSGKYACMSDFIRVRIFRKLDKQVLTLDEETNQQLKTLDYELNKIGVNLNQLSKRINSFAGYNIGDKDRQLLRQAFDMMRDCLAFLQKYLR